MITSLKKVESNKKNALKSTGPKTVKGKNVVKWNALKHGLLSAEVVIDKGDGVEDKTEFKKMFSQLREDLHSVGILEEMLVERIAICYWRLRRVIRCENGEIRRGVDNIIWDSATNKYEKFQFDRKYIELDEQRNNIQKTSYGINYLIEELDEIKALIEEVGYISEDIKKKLIKNFGTDVMSLTVSCLFIQKLTEHYDQETESNLEIDKKPLPEKSKKLLLNVINDKEKKLKAMKDALKENETNELDSNWESLYLPSKEAVDKIIRYETTIERQLYRAITQLERLQSKRKFDFGFVS